MATTVKIGINLTSLAELPRASQSEPEHRFMIPLSEEQSVQGARNATYTGKLKQTITLKYDKRSFSELNTILNYANQPYQFWVEIKSDTTTYYQKLSYLLIESVQELVVSDDFRYTFDLLIKEI